MSGAKHLSPSAFKPFRVTFCLDHVHFLLLAVKLGSQKSQPAGGMNSPNAQAVKFEASQQNLKKKKKKQLKTAAMTHTQVTAWPNRDLN